MTKPSATFDLGPAIFPELDHIVYFSGVSTRQSESASRPDLGLLVTPRNSVHRKAGHYGLIGADNGLYNERHPLKGFTLDPDRWLAWVADLPLDRTVFVTLPDVLNWYLDPEAEAAGKRDPYFCIGDFEATLERSALYHEQVRGLGFPVALVAQDGLERLDQIPFDVDAIFVGGSDDYKLGPTAAGLVREAREAGTWTHLGRVNSAKRLRHAHAIGCDSADGTFLGFAPTANFPRMIGWLDGLAGELRPVVDCQG